MNTEKFKKIRKEQYHLTEKFAYLDTSTTGLISQNSKNAMTAFMENRFENAMNIDQVRENWEFTDNLRPIVAEVLNANSKEIFFGANCSEMLNIFSNGIELRENANIVTSGLSFPSTPYNWINRVGEKNVRIVPAENGQVSAQSLFNNCDENTAVIALCLVENSSGFRHDIVEISKFCQEKGIYLVLDAAQCIGAINIDVKETPIDFLVASTYKWMCGLFGVAFGYISERVLNKIETQTIGWAGNKSRFNHGTLVLDLSENANKFECGNPNWLGLRGLEQSIKIYLELGKKDVHEYILSLTDYLYKEIEKVDNVEIIGPFDEKNRSGITYLTFPKEWGLDNEVLAKNKIRSNVSNGSAMRVALHFYNNEEDVDALCEFFKKHQ